jgi:hypothetical protein
MGKRYKKHVDSASPHKISSKQKIRRQGYKRGKVRPPESPSLDNNSRFSQKSIELFTAHEIALAAVDRMKKWDEKIARQDARDARKKEKERQESLINKGFKLDLDNLVLVD